MPADKSHLTPAPVEDEPDALGEVEIPEDFTKWQASVAEQLSGNTQIEVIRDDADRDIGYAHEFVWKAARCLGPRFLAYRIISEPAAGEGGGGEYDELTDQHESAMETAAIARDLEAQPTPEPSDYFPTQPFTIGASKPHADESDAQMFAAGINRELEKA